MTKKEAEKLCTAVRGTDIYLSTDYHVSAQFVLKFLSTVYLLPLFPISFLKKQFLEGRKEGRKEGLFIKRGV